MALGRIGTTYTGADAGFLKVETLRVRRKKGVAGARGPALGPMLKNLYRGPDGSPDPCPPGSAPEYTTFPLIDG